MDDVEVTEALSGTRSPLYKTHIDDTGLTILTALRQRPISTPDGLL
jgi:hypothetical protein